MSLVKGHSKSARKKNIKELTHGKVGKSRSKAIGTLARKLGISRKAARARQAVAISYHT